MPRCFEVNYLDSYWNGGVPNNDENEVVVYLELDCQEFIFHARNQILKVYHKKKIDLDTFIRFKIDAESGNLKFYVSEDYDQLTII